MKALLKSTIVCSLALFGVSAMAQNYRSPLIATSQWENWELNLIRLDNNLKPTDKRSIDLGKEVKLSHQNLSISIFPETLDDLGGKVIRFTCNENDTQITQKFGTPEQLRGYALQMPCGKSKYYFIIDPKK